MQKLVILSFVLRAFGFVAVLVYFFGSDGWISDTFPGLETKNPIFYTGLVSYLIGAVVYYFVNRKIRADKRKQDAVESEEK